MKELLNFQNPLPFVSLFSFDWETWTGEWSVDKDVKMYASFTNSWRSLEIKIYSQAYVE